MKRLLYLLIVAVLALSWGGCKKFLNTKPTDTLTPEEYYGSESKLTAALAGVYDPLGNEFRFYNTSDNRVVEKLLHWY